MTDIPSETDINEKEADVDVSKALGTRIRKLRQSGAKKLTQEDLAEQADISVSFLSMIERGERAPHIGTLLRIAAALGVSIGELFLFANKEEPQLLDPMLRPLAEFVRNSSLTRRDMERLLDVAKAMFQP